MKKLIFWLFILFYFPVLAQKELLLTDASNRVSVEATCLGFKDDSQHFTEKDFGNATFEKQFKPFISSKPSFGYTNATVWLKIKVKSTTNKHWFLALDNPSTNVAECFLTQNNLLLSKQTAGDSFDFSTYQVPDRNPIFDLPLTNNVEQLPQSFTLYLKLKNTESLEAPLTFWEEKQLMAHLAQRNIFWGIFFGFILLIAVYNFFLWVSIKELSYLFYVGYVISFGLFQAALFGYGFQYFWGSGVFNEKAHVLFVGLTVTFLVLFTIQFLEVFKIFPASQKTIETFGYCWAIVFPTMVLTFNEYTNYFIVAITIFSICLQYYFCFKLILVKNRNVRYYLLAMLCMTIAIIAVILKGFGLFFTGDYYLKLGSMLEITLFSLALGDKYRQEHLEKERQQRLRDEISANLHDDLAASLSSLTMFSESNRRKAQKISSENEAVFSRISEKSREILSLVRENVWEMNPRNDQSEEWLDRMIKFASETLESKQIDLELNISEEMNTFLLPIDYRHDLHLFLKEAINNIAKHSEADWVKMEVFLQQKTFHLTIKDNGKGFNTNELSKGNGLLNLQNRANHLKGTFEINSSIGQGTELRLFFRVK